MPVAFQAGFSEVKSGLMRILGSKADIQVITSIFCALVLVCLFSPTAQARDDSTTQPSTKKSTTTKSTKTRHAKTSSSKSSSATRTSSKKRSSKKTKKVRGQQKIDPERAQEIQQALIREHYLTESQAASGWNQASEDAMRKYQADHGWQSKTVPDSRALISLGLGPSKDHLLNPESAMTTVPDRPKSQTIPATSNSASPSASPLPTTSSPSPASSDPSSPQ